MPDAFGPRNDGQLPFALAIGRAGGFPLPVLTISRGGRFTVSPAGSHMLRSMIICRTLHSSETRLNERRLPSVSYRYLPGLSQPPGPPEISSSTSEPRSFHVPLSLGQRSPSTLNVPAGSNRALKMPNVSGCEGSAAFD